MALCGITARASLPELIQFVSYCFIRGCIPITTAEIPNSPWSAPSTPRLHAVGATADGGDAGAADIDEAKGAHEIDESVDLGGRTGHFEDEAFQ